MRRPELGAVLAAALTLAGCGSGSEERAARQPKLSQPVAAALAALSDDVAQTLAAGDSCRALTVARQLQQETVAAINAGRVPAPFQEQLGSTVGDLVSRIRCVPAVNPHDSGKHKGKDKKKHERDG
jgi:outer membrane murein-binding lipoprotein Lpp